MSEEGLMNSVKLFCQADKSFDDGGVELCV